MGIKQFKTDASRVSTQHTPLTGWSKDSWHTICGKLPKECATIFHTDLRPNITITIKRIQRHTDTWITPVAHYGLTKLMTLQHSGLQGIQHEENSPQPPSGSSHFPFGALPFEIQSQIWRICLIQPVPINIEDEDHAYHGRYTADEVHLTQKSPHAIISDSTFNGRILFVNRIVYEEGVKILYSRNVFRFRSSNAWLSFFNFDLKMRPQTAQYIRKLDLPFPEVGRVGTYEGRYNDGTITG